MSILNILPSKSPKSKHLLLPGLENQIDRYLSATRILEHAEADQALVKEALAQPVREHFFRANHGLAAPCKSVRLPGNLGSVLVSFSSIWNPKTEQPALPATMLREQFTIAIKGDEIPPEKAEPFVKALLALAAEHGVSDAITAKAKRVPVPAFAELRHRDLTVEQNLALEAEGLGTRVSWKVESVADPAPQPPRAAPTMGEIMYLIGKNGGAF